MSDICLDPHNIKQYITRYFESANLVKNELEIGVKYTWKHSWMHRMHKNAVIWQTIRNLVLWNDSGFTGQLKAKICQYFINTVILPPLAVHDQWSMTTCSAWPPAVQHQLQCDTTSSASPLQHITTSSASQPAVHHNLQYNTTCRASPHTVHHHFQCITTFSASAPAVHHHLQCITTCSTSPPAVHRHLQYITTFSASSPAVHHHLQCITTFSASPPAVHLYPHCISTRSASSPQVHHNMQCITTFSASPSAEHHHLQFITTFSTPRSLGASFLRSL